MLQAARIMQENHLYRLVVVDDQNNTPLAITNHSHILRFLFSHVSTLTLLFAEHNLLSYAGGQNAGAEAVRQAAKGHRPRHVDESCDCAFVLLSSVSESSVEFCVEKVTKCYVCHVFNGKNGLFRHKSHVFR